MELFEGYCVEKYSSDTHKHITHIFILNFIIYEYV